MKGIQVCLKERDSPSPRGDDSESKNTLKFFKNLLPNQQAKSNQTLYKLLGLRRYSP
jgi:hypothetical protein